MIKSNLVFSLLLASLFLSLNLSAADPIFTDADLKTVLAASEKKKTTGLIYMWSPKSRNSIMLAKDVMQVAAQRNMKVTLLHSISNAGTANTQSKLSRSFILRTIGMNAAAPAVQIFHEGELIGRPLSGKITVESINTYIDKTILEKVECSPKKLAAMGAGAKLPVKCQQLAKRSKQTKSTQQVEKDNSKPKSQ